LIEKLWRDFFRRQIVMDLTPDQFRVRRSLFWTRYDRSLSHRFALYAHDKTRQEALDAQFKEKKAEKRGRVIQLRRYHQESRHLSFDYLGQRNVIADIYDIREAQAIQKRLAAIDDVLDAYTKHGDGTPLKPDDQWVKQPGEIPDTSGR
jgi:hypothetical protein